MKTGTETYYIFLISLLALLPACSQKTETDPVIYHPAVLSDGILEITAAFPEELPYDSVKAGMEETASGSLKAVWEEGDELSINGKIFRIAEGCSGGTAARFIGEVPEGDKYDIIYPASSGETEHSNGENPLQKGNGNAGHLRYSAILKGVGRCDNIEFSSSWAGANGGTFEQMSCLKFVVDLPDEITAVASLSLDCGETVYGLDFENAVIGDDHRLVAWLPVKDVPIVFADGQKVRFSVVSREGVILTKVFKPEAQILHGGRINEFAIAGEWKEGIGEGLGTEESPFIIRTAVEFDCIRDVISADTMTYFRLEEDLDLSGLQEWTPFNPNNLAVGISFDGNGHSISNFRCEGSTKWASIFGVLHGSVKNLTIVDPVLVNSYNAPAGILCAWAGNVNGVLGAEITDVHIVNGRMEMANATQYFGGMIGNAVNSTIRNCSFDGTVLRSTGTEGTYTYAGGLIGWTGGGDAPETSVLVEGCSSSGSINTVNGRCTGGLIGYVYQTSVIRDSHSSMDVTAGNDVAGGLLGIGSGQVINCYAEGDVTCGVTSSSYKNSYIGGLIGHVPANTSLLISDSRYTGTVKGSGNYAGGLIGQCLTTAEIRRCYADARVSGLSVCGGLAGRTGANTRVVFEDCYSSGSVTGTSYVGGLVGDLYQDNAVRNCYSTMSVTGTFGLGGLIARASNASAATIQMGGQNFNNTVSGCISWGSLTSTSVSTNTPSTRYSGGAVIGYTAEKNTLTGNYRKPEMSFSYYPGAEYNVLYDQPDTGPEAALQRNYTDKYYFPYHGRAAASDATVSSVARLCGWDEAVWNLGGDYPVLIVQNGGGK